MCAQNIKPIHQTCMIEAICSRVEESRLGLSKQDDCIYLCPKSYTCTKLDGMLLCREEHPMFVGHMQQDAQEVLRCLLTSIQESCRELASGEWVKSTPENLPSSSTHILATDEGADVLTLARKKLKLVGASCTDGQANMKSHNKQKLSAYYSLFGTTDHISSSNCVAPLSSKNGSVLQRLWIRKYDLILKTFQGMLAYQTRCFECDNCATSTEAFLDISLPVGSGGLSGFPTRCTPEEPVVGNSAVGPFSLSWALSQFARHERLAGGNKYWCDRCGHLGEAERSVLFASLPPVVTIHLNRFTTHSLGLLSAVNVRKVGGNIAVPATLCFKPWCVDTCANKDQLYHLFAVVFHYGATCHSGHYTTCVRAQECFVMKAQSKVECDGTWISFDDDRVESMSQSELLDMLSPLSSGSHTAYILFYRVM